MEFYCWGTCQEVWDSSPLSIDNLHQNNEQAEVVDKWVVADMKSDPLRIVHQQRVEDKSLDLSDKFGM
jgi:hypothetical protein